MIKLSGQIECAILWSKCCASRVLNAAKLRKLRTMPNLGLVQPDLRAPGYSKGKHVDMLNFLVYGLQRPAMSKICMIEYFDFYPLSESHAKPVRKCVFSAQQILTDRSKYILQTKALKSTFLHNLLRSL